MSALDARRATVDADLMVRRLHLEAEQIIDVVREICLLTMPVADGVAFHPETASSKVIREGDQYSGVRVVVNASIATAHVKVQLDVSAGDPITPAPVAVFLPTLRKGLPTLRVLGYPIETVLAEKLCTAISLGDANTRVRDYADVWTLTGKHSIDGRLLLAALISTSTHRGVALLPLSGVLNDLATVRDRAYRAYRRGLGPTGAALPDTFSLVVAHVIDFFDPVLLNDGDHHVWNPVTRSWQWGTD